MHLRRFTGRRGNVRLIRSVNGSNFIGASAELIQAFQEMDHSGISSYLEEHGGELINWKRNPPFASKMGGVWELQIQSVRMILSSLLKTHSGSLTDESLQTLLVEVEAMVNSCPLTTETINDITSLIPLSPINFLTMKLKIAMPPPGVFASPDKYCRTHWRRVQHICNEFWNMWRKEVLLSLQSRTKSNNPTKNCRVGGIVLLKNEADHNQWQMGKIVTTNKDDKGDV